MKNRVSIFAVIFLTTVSFYSCKKDKESNSTTTVTDIDGNIYNVVKIGNQYWMKENLKTTRYNDSTPIPTGLSDAAWQSTPSGAYAIYDNNSGNNDVYGKLYNWHAINTAKLAPAGWHVPTDAEWTTLVNTLGGGSVAGGAMKGTTTTWWNSPNTGATNSSGFTGLPAGSRYSNGPFNRIGIIGFFWSSNASAFILNYDDSVVDNSNSGLKENGFSVRCVKD